MQIKDLLQLMWRNVGYLVLGIVLGAGIGLVISVRQTPLYEATAKIFVGRTSQQPSSDVLLLDDEQLLAINLQLAKFLPVDNISSKAANIQIAEIPNTQILTIKVQAKDPQLAANIANSVVQSLIQQNVTLLSGRYTGFENAVNERIVEVQKQIDNLQTQINQTTDTGIQEQLDQVNQQIEKINTEISGLEQEISNFPTFPTPLEDYLISEKQAQVDQLHSLLTLYQEIQSNLTFIGKPGNNGESLGNPRLTTLQATLELYQQINSNLINNRETVLMASAQASQYIMPIVSATPPYSPVLPMPVPFFLIGGLAGLALTAIAILMIDHMDDSLKTVGQIEELLGLPVLGFVATKKSIRSEVLFSHDPSPREIEALRDLAVNIDLIAGDKKVSTLLVTNIEPIGNKTTIAANLAIIKAQLGKRVILLDGDLRQPHLHNLFKLENKEGMIDLLSDEFDSTGLIQVADEHNSFTVIPSGIVPIDTMKFPDAENLTRLFPKLRTHADLIIVDGPAAEVADTQMLASKVDAVLLLINSGHTNADRTQAAVKRLEFAGARVLGAVLFSNRRIRQ